MGYDVQVEIDKAATNGTFTNFDVIRGKVKLTTTTPLSLSCIQVKLEGVAKTQFLIRNPRKNNLERLYRDMHKILFDSAVVFPPENVRLVSRGKEFTLTPGSYSYDFSFKIPFETSCKKLEGISNKVSINKNFNVVINNGNFNTSTMMHQANDYLQRLSNPNQARPPQQPARNYHVTSQLPPSMEMGNSASITYFVKATCKRLSMFSINLRATDPFTFLPLDMSDTEQALGPQDRLDFRERFFRKLVVFHGHRIEQQGGDVKSLPTPPKSGFFLSFLGSKGPSTPSRSPSTQASLLAVSFEMRLPYVAALAPNKPPSFKLFLISDVNPARFSLANYGRPDESSGLGVVYLQSLKFELRSVTYISVLFQDSTCKDIHQSALEETIPLCNNTYQNVALDMFRSTRQVPLSTTSRDGISGDAYELQIPSVYYENFRVPRTLAPTFKTCNIERTYQLRIVAGISGEKVIEPGLASETRHKVQYVDLVCPEIQITSGLSATEMGPPPLKKGEAPAYAGTLEYPPEKQGFPETGNAGPLAQVPDYAGEESHGETSLPSYDDAVRNNR